MRAAGAITNVLTRPGCPGHIGKPMAFEWNEDNRKAHLAKHGVDFRDVTAMFDGPTVEIVDDRYDYGETRINALGEIEGRVYVVAYTWRRDSRRFISARKANARERKTYYTRVG
jgi:uncharacterized protein